MPERLRVVWLFGRPYWWHTTPRGQLALMPATWLDPNKTAIPEER